MPGAEIGALGRLLITQITNQRMLGAMKQRILSYRTLPCHRRPLIARNCSASLQHFQTGTECCLEFARRLSNVV